MRGVADILERLDDPGRVDFAVPPIDGEAMLGEIQPGVDNTRQLGEPAFDLADAGGAADAVHGQSHVRQTGLVMLDKGRQIDCFSHRTLRKICSPQHDAVARPKELLAAAR